MKKTIIALLLMVLVLPGFVSFSSASGKKIIIAHRGACGYLPEHSLEAKAMAYAMGADYIEQDLVMTKDNRLVVLHDHYLDRVTDVAEVFPSRKRKDGRYYVIDFTLDEIKKLKMTEGFSLENNKKKPNFPKRFPLWKSSFEVSTFDEEIELIQGLNSSTGRNVGIYPEIKSPWFHRHEGKDISLAVINVLKEYGYTSKNDLIYLQCFDPNELKIIKNKIFPQTGVNVKLVQLIAETDWNETMEYVNGKAVPYNYDWMFEKGAMAEISSYADGIGPWKPMIVKDGSTGTNLIITDMVKEAHSNGMEVHPYTFRLDNGRIPEYAASFEDMLDIFLFKADVDGVFTDFPDRGAEFLRRALYMKKL
ncbi:MAG: glycerophosphodiester phosphodiesterase [Desulforegulaceae bacterium]|nr:glycerophosphodiester phosphodiesterase [Desulforegulaceae bacterium]